jgi:hypothetical protein
MLGKKEFGKTERRINRRNKLNKPNKHNEPNAPNKQAPSWRQALS